MSTTSDEADITMSPDEIQLFHSGDGQLLVDCIGHTLLALMSHKNMEEDGVLDNMIQQALVGFFMTWQSFTDDHAYAGYRNACHNVIFDAAQRGLKTCENTERAVLMRWREVGMHSGNARDTPEHPLAALLLAHTILDSFLQTVARMKHYVKSNTKSESHQRLVEMETKVMEKWQVSLQQLSRPCQEIIRQDEDSVDEGIDEERLAALKMIFQLVGLSHLLDEELEPLKSVANTSNAEPEEQEQEATSVTN